MAFNKKTVRDVNLTGKRVLLGADYNVPVEAGKITDDYRLRASLPTIKYILDQRPAGLIIISHLGRPAGHPEPAFSLRPVARHLTQLLGHDVHFAEDCIGLAAHTAAAQLRPDQILMLENLRFHAEEEKNDPRFAKALVEATAAEVLVADGFGVVHRAHASTVAITKLLPAVAGLLLAREVEVITALRKKPLRPLVAVLGGAKIADKIELLEQMIELADTVAVAGAMANNFLVAEGLKVGKSVVDHGMIAETKHILAKARCAERERNFNFIIPVDAVVSTDIDGGRPTRVVDLTSHSLADIEAYPKLPPASASNVHADELILDIGPISAGTIVGAVKLAEAVIWNGSCGVTETKGMAGAAAPFAHASRLVAEAMMGASLHHRNRPFTFVGGGDTVGYVEAEGWTEDFSHVSTGGGASLELLTGHKLPGVEALESRNDVQSKRKRIKVDG